MSSEVAAPPRPTQDVQWTRCPSCDAFVYHKRLKRNLGVCPECNYHFRLGVNERLTQLLDEGSFDDLSGDIQPVDPLSFADSKPYRQRLEEAQRKTGHPEGAPPALPPDLRLDHPVDGVDLVVGVVVDLPEPREGGGGVHRMIEGQVELGHVEQGQRVARVGLGELLRRGEGILGTLRGAVDLEQSPPRAQAVRIALDRLPDVPDRVLRIAGRVRGVRELDERADVVRPELHGLPERAGRILQPVLVQERVAVFAPRVRVLRLELDRLREVVRRAGQVELRSGLAREPEEAHVVGAVAQPALGGLAGGAEVALLVQRVRLAGVLGFRRHASDTTR